MIPQKEDTKKSLSFYLPTPANLPTYLNPKRCFLIPAAGPFRGNSRGKPSLPSTFVSTTRASLRQRLASSPVDPAWGVSVGSLSLPPEESRKLFCEKPAKNMEIQEGCKKKKKESPEKKHHHSPELYMFFPLGCWMNAKKKRCHIFLKPSKLVKNWVVLYILLQKKGTFPSHSRPNPTRFATNLAMLR